MFVKSKNKGQIGPPQNRRVPQKFEGSLHCKSLQPECNHSAVNSCDTCNFQLQQPLVAIFAVIWLQGKSAVFRCKFYIYQLLHLLAANLGENLYLYIICHIFTHHSRQLTWQSMRVWCERSWVRSQMKLVIVFSSSRLQLIGTNNAVNSCFINNCIVATFAA